MEHPFRDAFLGLPPERTERFADLLKAAALQALRKRAGQVPLQVTPFAGAPVPDEEESPEAANLILRKLLEKPDYLLSEYWLKQAQAQGFRPPSALLPLLFRQGLRAEHLGRTLFQTLGERGHWLAAQNPEWAAFLPYSHPANENPHFWAQYQHGLALRHDDPAAFRRELRRWLPASRTLERRELFALLAFNADASDVPFLVEYLDAFAFGVSDLAQRYLYRQEAEPWYGKLRHVLRQTLDLDSRTPRIDPSEQHYPPELGFAPDMPHKALVKQLASLLTAEDWAGLEAEQVESLMYDPVFGKAAGLGLLAALSSAETTEPVVLVLQNWYHAPAFQDIHSRTAGQWAEQLPEAARQPLLEQSYRHDGRLLRDILHPERGFSPLPASLSKAIFTFFAERVFPHTARPDTQQWAEALKVFFRCVTLEDTQDWQLQPHAMSPFWQSYWSQYEKLLRTRRKIRRAFGT